MTADEATLLETDGSEWGPRATANAITEAIRDHGDTDDVEFDLLLFGNESADMANYQVGTRVANALDLPFVAGIKTLDVADGTATAKREVAGGEEVYELDLPAAISVKEGINEPRYASMRAKMKARKTEVDSRAPAAGEFEGVLAKQELAVPEQDDTTAEVLGEGPEAVPEIVRVLDEDVEVL
jgi:electron transfer flavoprotein beta subunit